MKTNLFFKSIFLLLFASLIWFCEAPRNNPLDPESPGYKFLDLTGRVLTYRVPHVAIPNVKVTWDDSQYDYTDNSGFFRFNETVREPGWLYFESQKYLIDSIYVDWSLTSSGLLKYLNTRPVLDSILFYSSIDNRDNDRQLLNLKAKVAVTDPDNDIDSVLVISPTLNFYSFLNYNLNDKSFEGSFGPSDLKISKPDVVIGHDFFIYIKDNQQNRILMSTQIIKRIIKEKTVLKQPINSDTTSITPTLDWEPIDPGFPFEFMVEIYLDDFQSPLIWRKENINSSTTSITVDAPLTEDRYYRWIVWVIDEFQNRSGSKPRTFYAKSP